MSLLLPNPTLSPMEIAAVNETFAEGKYLGWDLEASPYGNGTAHVAYGGKKRLFSAANSNVFRALYAQACSLRKN